jgi:hypothetical protein
MNRSADPLARGPSIDELLDRAVAAINRGDRVASYYKICRYTDLMYCAFNPLFVHAGILDICDERVDIVGDAHLPQVVSPSRHVEGEHGQLRCQPVDLVDGELP